MNIEQLKHFKIMVGQFYEEVKSNSITELLSWLDCKYLYYQDLKERHTSLLKNQQKRNKK